MTIDREALEGFLQVVEERAERRRRLARDHHRRPAVSTRFWAAVLHYTAEALEQVAEELRKILEESKP